MMKKNRRVSAYIILFVFFLFLVISLLALSLEAHHVCVGDECRICLTVTGLCELFDSILALFILTAFCFLPSAFFSGPALEWGTFYAFSSPVSRKVKLLN